MSTLNSSLKAVANIGMHDQAGDTVSTAPSIGTATTYEFLWGADRLNIDGFYIAWESTYKTFQIRWRVRHRVRPTASAAGGWGGWSAWQGAGTCSSKTARGTLVTPSDTQNWDKWNMANARPSRSTNLYNANQNLYVHYVKCTSCYAVGTYDCTQYEVQVRPYDEGAVKHGNTTTTTLHIQNEPSFSIATMVRGGQTVKKVMLDTDGSLLVYYATNWNHDGNHGYIYFRDTGKSFDLIGLKGGLNSSPYMKIPTSKLDKNYDVGDTVNAYIRFMTHDNPGGANDADLDCTVFSKFTTHEVNPTWKLDLDEDAHKATVTITEEAVGYPWLDVKCWAGWTEPGTGKWKTTSPSVTVTKNLSGRRAVFEFTNVPSDISVLYRAQVLTADSDADPRTLQQWGRMSSQGRAFLTVGGKCAQLVCALEEEAGVTWTRSFAPNVEAEVCAGRVREVARHGIGGTASMQVKGDIVYDTASWDMGAGRRLADWEELKAKTGSDGFIALPQGISAKVAVTGIDIDTARPSHAVTVDLEEVE